MSDDTIAELLEQLKGVDDLRNPLLPTESDALKDLLDSVGMRLSLIAGAPADKLSYRLPAVGGYFHLVPDLIVSTLHSMAAAKGTAPAVEWLNRLCGKKAVPARMVIAILGLQVATETEVAGIKLLPLTGLNQSPNFHRWFDYLHSSTELFQIGAVAVLEYEIPEWLASNTSHSDLEAFKTWSQRVDLVLKAIGYADGGAPSLGPMFGEYLDEDLDELQLRAGILPTAPENAPRPLSLTALTRKGIEAARRHLSLTGKLRDKLDLAASRLTLARRRIGEADRSIDISIALEALLGDNRFDHTYKLGLRAARLIEADFERRQAIRNSIKRFYEIRGDVVHGSQSLTFNDKEIANIRSAEDICAQLLRDIVERGTLPNWDEVELS